MTVSIKKETYDQIELLVKDKDDKDNTEQLLLKFNPLFKKMETAIRYQNIYNDPKINLMVSAMVYTILSKQEIDSNDKNVLRGNTALFFNYLSETRHLEDLHQDILCAFIVILNRYEKKPDAGFCAYVNVALPREIGRRLAKRIRCEYKDYLSCGSNSEGFEITPQGQSYSYGDDPTFDEVYDRMNGSDNILTQNWIDAKQCDSFQFNRLSAQERLMLILKYQDKVPDRISAKELGMHINTYNIMKRKAVEKISKIKPTRMRNSGSTAMSLYTLRQQIPHSLLMIDVCTSCNNYLACSKASDFRDFCAKWRADLTASGIRFVLGCKKIKHKQNKTSSVLAPEMNCDTCFNKNTCFNRETEPLQFLIAESIYPSKDSDFYTIVTCDNWASIAHDKNRRAA